MVLGHICYCVSVFMCTFGIFWWWSLAFVTFILNWSFNEVQHWRLKSLWLYRISTDCYLCWEWRYSSSSFFSPLLGDSVLNENSRFLATPPHCPLWTSSMSTSNFGVSSYFFLEFVVLESPFLRCKMKLFGWDLITIRIRKTVKYCWNLKLNLISYIF